MPAEPKTRVGRWLWAARFFKTRSLAADAVAGGKVAVNGERAKPAKLVGPGDKVAVQMGPFAHVLRVRALAERRGSAEIARTLYEETPDSLSARQRLAEQLRIAPAAFVFEGKGRPTKKDRREIARLID